LRIAVVHHWFVTRGGGERVAECIAALFPKAEIFTLLATAKALPATLAGRPLHTSFLQRLPLAANHHRRLLPLYPAATESLDLRGFDLVLSSDSGPVKGVRVDPGAVQICYCHSPMRYLWDGYEPYRAAMSGVTRWAFTASVPRLRRWDAEVAGKRVTEFLANSDYVADRIRRTYHREASVIHPPIDLFRAAPFVDVVPGHHYLCAGRLVPYKRTEILIEACRRLDRRLRIAGAGPELARLREMAAGDPRIEFVGELQVAEFWAEYAACRALLFTADEDFGMVPLEAQACGRPVIAFGAGGSLETVRVGGARATGAYFAEQTTESAMAAISRWENELERDFRPEYAREWAAGFGLPRFLEQYRAFVLEHVPEAEAEAIPASAAAAIVSA
jgi:glycosyltransferase involved in cell wall biosynthesis